MRLKVKGADQSTRMLFMTARITAAGDGFVSNGTGFYFNSGLKDYLVTNKHVIEGASQISIPVHRLAADDPRFVDLGMHREHFISPNDWHYHPDPGIDLCCVPTSQIFDGMDPSERFFISISAGSVIDETQSANMAASLGVAMIGYPNGLWDEAHGLPIIRKGATASHPGVRFNDRDEVVLDMACFPGSSGSPVLYLDRKYFASAQRFLGILYAGPTIDIEGKVLVSKIPTSNNGRFIAQSMMHLGYVIAGKVLLDFVLDLEKAKRKFNSENLPD